MGRLRKGDRGSALSGPFLHDCWLWLLTGPFQTDCWKRRAPKLLLPYPSNSSTKDTTTPGSYCQKETHVTQETQMFWGQAIKNCDWVRLAHMPTSVAWGLDRNSWLTGPFPQQGWSRREVAPIGKRWRRWMTKTTDVHPLPLPTPGPGALGLPVRFVSAPQGRQLVLLSSPRVPKEKDLGCLKQIIFDKYHIESAGDFTPI